MCLFSPFTDDYQNLEIYFTWQRNLENSIPVFRETDYVSETSVSFDQPRKTRYITLVLRGAVEKMTICELEVYGGKSYCRLPNLHSWSSFNEKIEDNQLVILI